MSEQEYVEEFDDLPVSQAVRVIRKADDIGHVPGLPDEELADVAELERWAFRELWGPTLFLDSGRDEAEIDGKYGGDAPCAIDMQKRESFGASSGGAFEAVEDRARDIAVCHSCARDEESRARARRRFKHLVDSRYRTRALALARRIQREKDEEKREAMLGRLDELNRSIRRLKEIWDKYAHLE